MVKIAEDGTEHQSIVSCGATNTLILVDHSTTHNCGVYCSGGKPPNKNGVTVGFRASPPKTIHPKP
eukprot:scaffold23990_cov47-Cyclotella_meneghiniana.AAC.4